ncbi:MAG: transcription initiation factor IIB [Nitrosopumilus sp.]|nr:transcription initiation factor IIB [Nitrosopumilus sp.]MDH3488544.1 transcription initiation factor IIB [Nitrosopumilus sp.]
MIQNILEDIDNDKLDYKLLCRHVQVISDEQRGEEICGSCAQVLEDHIVDYSGEIFSENFEHSQIGPKSTLMIHDVGLSTVINTSNVDSQGKPISFKMKGAMHRARILDSRSRTRTSASKNLRIALIELGRLKEKMALSDPIIERAAYFYRKSIENGLRGKSVKATIGACLYAACRDMGTTRTIIDISNNIQENRKTIAKGYRDLFQQLSLKVPVPDPLETIIRVANNLKITENTKREAFLILDTLRKQSAIAGKNPTSVAATVLYMAGIKTMENMSQAQIATVAEVTSVTIRNNLKDFTKHVPLI